MSDEREEPIETVDVSEPRHEFHTSLFGTVWCDTCNSPYCDEL
jgi:hypothetical protein